MAAAISGNAVAVDEYFVQSTEPREFLALQVSRAWPTLRLAAQESGVTPPAPGDLSNLPLVAYARNLLHCVLYTNEAFIQTNASDPRALEQAVNSVRGWASRWNERTMKDMADTLRSNTASNQEGQVAEALAR